MFIYSECALLLVMVLGIYIRSTTNPHPTIVFWPSEDKYKTNDGKSLKFDDIDDQPTVDLSVIVPAYNEEDRLPAMLDECLEYLEGRKTSYEVIVVDDGSKDKTSDIGLKYTKQYGSSKVRKKSFEK